MEGLIKVKAIVHSRFSPWNVAVDGWSIVGKVLQHQQSSTCGHL